MCVCVCVCLFGAGGEYLGNGSTTTNRYFCVSRLPQSPTETKPEEKIHKLTKWISGSGCAAAGVEVVEVEEEEEPGRAVETGEALFG